MTPKIGLIACTHPYYELPEVAVHRRRAVEDLRAAGCEVVDLDVPRTALDAFYTAERIRAAEADLVILFFSTWVAEDITSSLARELGDIPLLLWAIPFLDRDIPMPSPLSGITSTASNLRRMGRRFAHHIGQVTSENVRFAVRAAKAAAVVNLLNGARFGLIGEPCPGMLDVEADESAIEAHLGAITVPLPLGMAIEAAASVAGDQTVQPACRLQEFGGAQELIEDELTANLRLYSGLKRIVEVNRLDGYCLRCWPELRDRMRVTPCAAHALMAEDGVPNTCEVDLTALITTFMLNRLADAPAFSFDITGYFEGESAVQLAHCGAAAPSLAGENGIRLRRHMRAGSGATVEFQFKSGRATLAKLLRPLNGKLRLFAAEAEVVESDGDVRGSVATVKPLQGAGAFLKRWLEEGVEHHISLVYGSWMGELEAFCQFTGTELIHWNRPAPG